MPPSETREGSPSPRPDPGRTPRLARSDRRVLVAEDDLDNQKLVVLMLELLGLEAVTVVCGRELFERLEQERFDLVLLDVNMPDMSGLEVAQRLRLAEAGTDRRLPLIALTANAVGGFRERCLAAGMDDYLSKPYTLDQLQTVLARWLALRPSQPRA